MSGSKWLSVRVRAFYMRVLAPNEDVEAKVQNALAKGLAEAKLFGTLYEKYSVPPIAELPPSESARVKGMLTSFYKMYNPSEEHKVEKLMGSAMREDELVAGLTVKYNASLEDFYGPTPSSNPAQPLQQQQPGSESTSVVAAVTQQPQSPPPLEPVEIFTSAAQPEEEPVAVKISATSEEQPTVKAAASNATTAAPVSGSSSLAVPQHGLHPTGSRTPQPMQISHAELKSTAMTPPPKSLRIPSTHASLPQYKFSSSSGPPKLELDAPSPPPAPAAVEAITSPHVATSTAIQPHRIDTANGAANGQLPTVQLQFDAARGHGAWGVRSIVASSAVSDGEQRCPGVRLVPCDPPGSAALYLTHSTDPLSETSLLLEVQTKQEKEDETATTRAGDRVFCGSCGWPFEFATLSSGFCTRCGTRVRRPTEMCDAATQVSEISFAMRPLQAADLSSDSSSSTQLLERQLLTLAETLNEMSTRASRLDDQLREEGARHAAAEEALRQKFASKLQGKCIVDARAISAWGKLVSDVSFRSSHPFPE